MNIKKDEITYYFQRRYIELIEAIWQIFKFLIYKKFLFLKQLPINFPKKESEKNKVAKQLQKRMNGISSNFIIFFEYNNIHKKSYQYFYQEFFKYYVYLQKKQQ